MVIEFQGYQNHEIHVNDYQERKTRRIFLKINENQHQNLRIIISLNLIFSPFDTPTSTAFTILIELLWFNHIPNVYYKHIPCFVIFVI